MLKTSLPCLLPWCVLLALSVFRCALSLDAAKAPTPGLSAAGVLNDLRDDTFAALRQAGFYGQDALVAFTAPWCAVCKRTLPLLEQVALEAETFRVYTVNISSEWSLAERFEVDRVPSILLIKTDERVFALSHWPLNVEKVLHFASKGFANTPPESAWTGPLSLLGDVRAFFGSLKGSAAKLVQIVKDVWAEHQSVSVEVKLAAFAGAGVGAALLLLALLFGVAHLSTQRGPRPHAE